MNATINGQVNHSAGTTFGQTATYSCNTGYTLEGNSTRTCQANGMWSGNEPTCISESNLLRMVMAHSKIDFGKIFSSPCILGVCIAIISVAFILWDVYCKQIVPQLLISMETNMPTCK